MLELRRERRGRLMRAGEHLVKLVALATIVASLMPLGAKYWWGFDLAAHFRVQYLVVDVILLGLLVWQRQWLWSGAVLACAAYSAVWVAPYVPFGVRTAAAASPAGVGATIELLAANVLYHNQSTERLLDLVRNESPDIVLLVEYTHEWSANVDELKTAYPHRIEIPGRRAEGIALFSRFPFDSADAFALGAMPAIEARVRTPSGPLTVFGIHLRSPTTPRRVAHRDRQLDLLAEVLANRQGPVAVMGDLNITPYSPFYVEFLERTGLTDTRAGRTLSPSWPSYFPLLGVPIDHCIVSRDIAVITHRGLPGIGSDHYPILAELALPGPTAGISGNRVHHE